MAKETVIYVLYCPWQAVRQRAGSSPSSGEEEEELLKQGAVDKGCCVASAVRGPGDVGLCRAGHAGDGAVSRCRAMPGCANPRPPGAGGEREQSARSGVPKASPPAFCWLPGAP